MILSQSTLQMMRNTVHGSVRQHGSRENHISAKKPEESSVFEMYYDFEELIEKIDCRIPYSCDQSRRKRGEFFR